ncbi:MAG TPA: hypothetical protein VGD72_11060 [Mycobacteriales bacterium]|jgi:hypothetical protein
MGVPLPHPKEVKDMFADMLGRDIGVTPCDAYTPVMTDRHSAAVYVDDQNQMQAVAVLDLPLSVWIGAAIGLVPVGGAQDQVDEGELSGAVRDNLYEVLNIFSALFNKPGATHLRIYAVHAPGEPVPSDVAVLVKSIGNRVDLDVEVGGYGKGKIGVVLAR